MVFQRNTVSKKVRRRGCTKSLLRVWHCERHRLARRRLAQTFAQTRRHRFSRGLSAFSLFVCCFDSLRSDKMLACFNRAVLPVVIQCSIFQRLRYLTSACGMGVETLSLNTTVHSASPIFVVVTSHSRFSSRLCCHVLFLLFRGGYCVR